jgi:hypothetical protein
MQETIVDVVKKDERLQSELKELVAKKFLVQGVFDPEAYLVDSQRIDDVWKNRGTKSDRTSLLAVGVAIYNQFFAELVKSSSAGDDPRASEETSELLSKWLSFLRNTLGAEAAQVHDTASTLGQYLEYMNRISQGF